MPPRKQAKLDKGRALKGFASEPSLSAFVKSIRNIMRIAVRSDVLASGKREKPKAGRRRRRRRVQPQGGGILNSSFAPLQPTHFEAKMD